jgi:glucose/mannose-6-phosphate isomerase
MQTVDDFLSIADKKVVESINNFPNQLLQSFTEILKIKYPFCFSNIENIILCGMGGSRFPALIIKSLYKNKISVPFDIVDDYILPKYVNNNSLVILSSYSGTTEEVLACFNQAKEKNACITAITSGGEISLELKKYNFPFYAFSPKYNPSGQPRIGLGYSIGALIGLLINLKLLNEKNENVLNSINDLKNLTQGFMIDVNKSNNIAKDLAYKVYEKYPYFIVSEFLTGVGNAIANQTNETSKSISSFRVIPELNHHLMEGLKHPKELKNIAFFIFFYSNLYSKSIKKRFEITKEVVKKNNIKTLWIELMGKTKLDQVFELVSLGSYFSMYLSMLYKEDPTVIPYVDYFKKRLKE